MATEIPQNCSLLLKSVGSNLKGTAIAAIVSDELADAATQMAALYPFMKQLVTSGSYDTGGSDGGKEKHKVNLLSSSERYYIANEVLTRLEAVNTDLLSWHGRYAHSHGTTSGSLLTRRMGKRDVRQEHNRWNRCGLEPGILIQLIQTM